MKYIFILNPTAGKNNQIENIKNTINSSLTNADIEYEIYVSKAIEDIKNICRNFCESSEQYRIYACGGDGTLNQLINMCYGFENIEIGVLPYGTGNDFIKATNIQCDNFLNIEKQINGISQYIDLIKYNDELCVNICNMGFDANTAMDMPKFKKLPFVSNHLAYYISLIYNLFKKWGRYMEIYADDELLYKGDTMMCAVSNGISCGGGFYVTPIAKIDDGFIDVSAVIPPKKTKILKFVNYYKNGTQLNHADALQYIHYKKCKKVIVKSNSHFAIVNDGDGKYMLQAEYEIIPHAIKFIMPK